MTYCHIFSFLLVLNVILNDPPFRKFFMDTMTVDQCWYSHVITMSFPLFCKISMVALVHTKSIGEGMHGLTIVVPLAIELAACTI